MKLLYIPLDERPCNYDYPAFVAEGNQSIDLIRPEKSLLGEKKKSAPVDALWSFIFDTIKDVDAAVLSMDMLLFGGLIPSRIHTLSKETVDQYVENLRKLRDANPAIKLYVSQCIMRCPSYNSSEEEPNYYADYGYAIFRRKYLLDELERFGLADEQLKELKSIEIPTDVLSDYETRRAFNLHYNIKIAELVKEGVLDFLVIPQDDSAPFGYTALAQKEVVAYLSKHHLETRVNIYPGADEVGLSLIARCLNEINASYTKVYAFYASTKGPLITPLYEDRPFAESLKYHLDVTRSYLVSTPQEADYILAINTPGEIMQEASQQNERDITYTSHRNLLYFVKEIARYIEQGYKVAICDSAYANGADIQLIKYLDSFHLLNRLHAYAGWNTNCNALGTVLSMAIYNLQSRQHERSYHLVYRILEDYIYQALVRQEVIREDLPIARLSYYNFKNKESYVTDVITQRIMNYYTLMNLSTVYPIKSLQTFMPWHRMFEVRFLLDI
ncbi:DUF4127 family protein [Erysipelothrix sp. HDW6C]|uniref:DUF4127 family protein n=1 Tax=Erysipelothrix sp. HDW6C TaxID=2714930 RepID=UPI00140B938E|nr:DUF4127 family protein [Erysipelothrix sp. HDW6C]QIK70283.1 DUF4127 family protein [Erysipelothrix sp. HDW6C]